MRETNKQMPLGWRRKFSAGAGQEISTRPLQLVTGRIHEAFELMHDGKSIRSVVTF